MVMMSLHDGDRWGQTAERRLQSNHSALLCLDSDCLTECAPDKRWSEDITQAEVSMKLCSTWLAHWQPRRGSGLAAGPEQALSALARLAELVVGGKG